MKLGIVAAATSVLLAGCNQKTAEVAPAAPEPATPAPLIAAATPAPAPKPTPELAPPGVFYLIATVRIETDSGITGLPPGTGVKLLHDDLYSTPAGEAHIAATNVTNDMGLARAARNADAAGQAAAQARISADGAAAAAKQRLADAQTPTPQAAALQAAPRSSFQPGTSLGETHDERASHGSYRDIYGHWHNY